MEDTMQTRLTVAIIAFAAAAALARGADGWRTSESARARLHADRIAELEHTYRGADGFDAFLAQERESLGEALSSLAGDTAPRRMPGMKLEAYFAENDGSAQPFWTYAPPAEDGAAASGEGAPLLVYLHGYVPHYDIVNTPTIPYMMTSLVARAGAYIAAPFGRSNTDFQGPGEQDVLRVIDEMHARYGIDRDRVLLVGYSMGGMGAWSAGGRFAEDGLHGLRRRPPGGVDAVLAPELHRAEDQFLRFRHLLMNSRTFSITQPCSSSVSEGNIGRARQCL